MDNSNLTRRGFLKSSAITSGAVVFSPFANAENSLIVDNRPGNPPREIWVASISQEGIFLPTAKQMLEKIEQLIEKITVYNPDIICLPETYPFANIHEKLDIPGKLEVSEIALQQCSRLAKEYNTYIICPVYISGSGNVFNAAVLFDRTGNRIGEYLKAHLTIGEIESGLTPGPLSPKNFQTDFGKVGIQICYDINWDDGWKTLREQGAEIVFWPSAFSGGQRLNAKASEHKYIVVSSTRKNDLRICDIGGKTIAGSGCWERNYICGPVTQGKVLIATWPHVQKFEEIHLKHGRSVKITTSHDEEWSVIESLSPDISVEDILDEYGIKTYFQDLKEAEEAQIKARQ
jgi:predicted amidohydrolase